MDYKKIITGLLSKAYKMDDGKVAELLKDGEEVSEETVIAALLSEDSNRVSAMKKTADTSEKFQEGYAKDKKEERENFEKELKEQFGIESDAIGSDLINEIITTKAEELGKGKKGSITEDDVKKHPVYQSLEGRYKTDLNKVEEEWKTKLEEIESNHKKEATFKSVRDRALVVLDGLNPVLPGNPEIASNQKGWFINALKDYEFDLQDEGRIVVMKDGRVVEDGHGNSLDFNDLAKQTASKFFEFKKNNGGSNAGNNNQGEGGNSGGSQGDYPAGIKKPTTLEELSAILNEQSIKIEDRERVAEVYEQENSE